MGGCRRQARQTQMGTPRLTRETVLAGVRNAARYGNRRYAASRPRPSAPARVDRPMRLGAGHKENWDHHDGKDRTGYGPLGYRFYDHDMIEHKEPADP